MNRALSLKQVRRLDDPKVSVLPTAPARQVRQNYNRAAGEKRRLLRKGQHTPEHWGTSPQEREALAFARSLNEIVKTPELVIILTILQFFKSDVRDALAETLRKSGCAGRAEQAALTVLRSTLLTVGQQFDLMRAQEILRHGGDL